MVRRLTTDAQLALEITQERIAKDDDERRQQDAERLRDVEAFLINLLEAFAT